MKPIYCILGPTASGKSSLALSVCERIGGEIVSCDSLQIYRDCDVVTAKPSLLDQTQIRHHLIDICEPNERFSAAHWAQCARAAIDDIESRGQTAVICGGSGFYLKALLHPEKITAPAPDESLRALLEKRLAHEGAPALRIHLKQLEPEIAAQLTPGDDYRLLRALQIAIQRARGDAVEALPTWTRPAMIWALQWPREALIERINSRIEKMLMNGALEETRALWEKYGEVAPALSGVGYQQLLSVLQGRNSLDNAVAQWKIATRQYAKRQMTWLRGQTSAVWLEGEKPEIPLTNSFFL